MLYRQVHVSNSENQKKRQGTFLDQARRAKVNERRQHETLSDILNLKQVYGYASNFFIFKW